ncbi:hypothetical protein [Parafrankia soli]|nr:hypothetical protein [Parafrankia soli]
MNKVLDVFSSLGIIEVLQSMSVSMSPAAQSVIAERGTDSSAIRPEASRM